MANFIPVKQAHEQKLKLSNKRDIKHVVGQHIVPVTAAEFAQASSSFPIVFVKNPESPRYRSVAMLGLEAGENLYFNDDKWSGLMLPQSLTMAPFGLGLDPELENTLTACVDIDSALVGEDKELALFEDDGKETELLTNVQNSLGRLYENEKMTENFIKELEENDLIHELEFLVNLSTGEKKKVTGIYTIDESKVKSLSDEKVVDFHKRGIFVPMFAMLGSLGQVNRLVQLRNLTGEGQIAGIQISPLAKEKEQVKEKAEA